MTRQLQFSVRRRRVQQARSGNDPEYVAYLDAISDVDATVELFDPDPHSPELARTQAILESHGLEIGTVHGPHLQGLLDRGEPGILLAYVRAAHLASTVDRMPEQAITPSVSTHHLPRLWPNDDRLTSSARRAFLSTYAEALPALEPDPTRSDLPDAFDGTLITATVALENVAPRTPHQYLLVTPGDVRALRRTAADLGVEEHLAFTCDVGHAAEPQAMLAAMESLVNVHLHSTVEVTDAEAERLCERFDIEDPPALGELDRPNVAHHLPPYVGDLNVASVFDQLDARGYEGPITVELSDIHRRAPVVYKTAETLAPYL